MLALNNARSSKSGSIENVGIKSYSEQWRAKFWKHNLKFGEAARGVARVVGRACVMSSEVKLRAAASGGSNVVMHAHPS
jgi:hypothetical protein